MKKKIFLILTFLFLNYSSVYALLGKTIAPFIGPEPTMGVGVEKAYKPDQSEWFPRIPGPTFFPSPPVAGAPLIVRVPVGSGHFEIPLGKVVMFWRYQHIDYTQSPPAYSDWSDWNQITMADDGNYISSGDEVANDGIFSCIIGADNIKPNTRIQYRFEVYDRMEGTLNKIGYDKGSNTAIESKTPPAATSDLTGPNAHLYWCRVIDDEDDPLTPNIESYSDPGGDAYDQQNGPGFTHLTYEGQNHDVIHHPRKVFVCHVLVNGKYGVIDQNGLPSFAPNNNHCGDPNYEDCHCVFHNMSPSECPAKDPLVGDPNNFSYPHHPRSLYPCGGFPNYPETWTVNPCSNNNSIYYKGCHGNSCHPWTSHAFCTDDNNDQCGSDYGVCSFFGCGDPGDVSKHHPYSLDIQSLDVAMNENNIWIKLKGRRMPDQPFNAGNSCDICELVGMACDIALEIEVNFGIIHFGMCDGRKRWFIYAWGVEIENEGGDKWLALNIPVLGHIMQQLGGVIGSFITLPLPYNGVLLMKSLVDLMNLLNPSPVAPPGSNHITVTLLPAENAIMYEIIRNKYYPAQSAVVVKQKTSDCPCCEERGGCPARVREETSTYKQPAMWIMGANNKMRYKFYAYSMVIPVHYAVQLGIGEQDPKRCQNQGGGFCDCWQLYPPYDDQGNPTEWVCTAQCPYYTASPPDKRESKEMEVPIGLPQVVDETVMGRFYRRAPRTIYVPPDNVACEKPRNIQVQQVGNDFHISWEAPTLYQGNYTFPNGATYPNIWQLRYPDGSVVKTVKGAPIIEAPGYKIDFNPVDLTSSYIPAYPPKIKGGYNIYRRHKKPGATSWSAWKWLNEDRDGNWQYKKDCGSTWASPVGDTDYFKEKTVTHTGGDGRTYTIPAPYGDRRPHRNKGTVNDLIKNHTGTGTETCYIWYRKKVGNDTVWARVQTNYTIAGNTITFIDPQITDPDCLDEDMKHLDGWQYQYKVASCDWPNPWNPNNSLTGANVFYKSQSQGFKDPLCTDYPNNSVESWSYGLLDKVPPYNDPAEIAFATVGITAGGGPPPEIPTGSPDINGDGVVDITDINILVQAFGSKRGDPNWNPNCDMNNDGQITLYDFGIVVKAYTSQGE